MLDSRSIFRRASLLTLALVAVFSAQVAQAARPVFDSGAELNQDAPYENAQVVNNVYETKAIFGKLQGATPVDIYTFTPDKDGSQTITLLGKKEKSTGQPVLIFVDPTTATTADNLNLQMPSSAYHPAVLKQATAGKTYREPWLFQDFNLLAQDHITLKKGVKYYMVVVNADPYNPVIHYAIKLGDGSALGFGDVITHFSSWYRLQIDSYAKTSPFTFNAFILGLIIFFAGFLLLAGTVLIQDVFSLMANRSKSAGYLLVKLQPFSRIFIWVSLWFVAVGGYIYFNHTGWVGVPFVLGLLFLVILVNMLFQTFVISPQISQLEVTKKEATIPLQLRKMSFISSIVSLVSLLAFLSYLAVNFAK